MSIIASAETTIHHEPIPEGQYSATCISLIDLGMQFNETYQKTQRKVMIMWELHDEDLEIEIDGEKKPRYISQEYTLSLNDKSRLFKDLNAWRGRNFTEDELKAFDVKTILGVPCLMQIIHTKKGDKTYANISSLMKLPKGMPKQTPKSPIIYFDIDTSTDEARANAIRTIKEDLPKLPDWIQKKIQESETVRGLFDGMSEIEQAAANGGIPVHEGVSTGDNGDFVEIGSDDDLPF